jgi:hypothetical protein
MKRDLAMNARRAANHSPSRIAYLTLEEDDLQFRWSAQEGKLLMFKGANPEETELVGQISPEEADAILNMSGWKPSDIDGPLRDWVWIACYWIGCRLHIPGFRKRVSSERSETMSASIVSRSSYPPAPGMQPSSSMDPSDSARRMKAPIS